MENSYLTLESRDDTAMDDLLGHSVTYRIAVGPHQGQKAFTLQTLAPRGDNEDPRLAKAAGFSLHCGVAAAARSGPELVARDTPSQGHDPLNPRQLPNPIQHSECSDRHTELPCERRLATQSWSRPAPCPRSPGECTAGRELSLLGDRAATC